MALRLMKLGNTLIKQVTSPPSTRLSTRMERRFSNQASHVPITDQDKETAWVGFRIICKLGFIAVAVFSEKFWEKRSARSDNRKEEARKQAFEAMEQRTNNLKREEDKLTQRRDDLESEMVKLYLKKHWITEPKRSDIGREN